MRDRILINGVLYESALDHVNDNYLPKRDDIIEDIDEANDDLKEAFREDLTPAAKKDRELKKLFGNASKSLVDLRDYLRKNYTTTDRIG